MFYFLNFDQDNEIFAGPAFFLNTCSNVLLVIKP
jgi:hypothetical protein